MVSRMRLSAPRILNAESTPGFVEGVGWPARSAAVEDWWPTMRRGLLNSKALRTVAWVSGPACGKMAYLVVWRPMSAWASGALGARRMLRRITLPATAKPYLESLRMETP